MRVTRLALASLGLLALFCGVGPVEAQEVVPPPTLWTFLGFPPAHRVHDHLTNRKGNHPNLERKPPRLKIADPKNLKSPVPAIATAAKIKEQEDLAPQKIKGIKYLASIGCGCYNRDGSITEALLAALDDCTETVRLAAADAIAGSAAGDCCENCGEHSCCTKDIHDRLMKMAYEMNAEGCWIEPSERVRRAAVRALMACPPQDEVPPVRGRELPPGERELPSGTPPEAIPPAPAPVLLPRTSAAADLSEPSVVPAEEETGEKESRPQEEVRKEQSRILKTNVEATRKEEVRAQEAKTADAPPQLKSSRRTAQLGRLQATPVATHRQSESQSPADLPAENDTIYRLPPVVDASSILVEQPAPIIVNKGTVDFIDLKQRLVVVRTSSEGQMPIGATVQAAHRFLTGPAVVGHLKVVASEPGTATLQPINGMQLTKVAQGDQITVSR
jgi:hypothetical protein